MPELVPEDVLRDPLDEDLERLLPGAGETADHPAPVRDEPLHDVLRQIVQGAVVHRLTPRETRAQGPLP